MAVTKSIVIRFIVVVVILFAPMVGGVAVLRVLVPVALPIAGAVIALILRAILCIVARV